MASTSMHLTVDTSKLERQLTETAERIERALAAREQQPSGAVAAGGVVAAALVLAGSGRHRVSRRRLLTFGRRG